MFHGVQLDVAIREINHKFKLAIQSKQGTGLLGLKRLFKRFDESGNGQLDAGEFEAALSSFGFFLKKVELQALMKYYDVDGSGSINYEEFARGMRDELAGRRLAMTKKAFIMMDRDKSGVITKEDLIGIYDVSKNPYFINRQKTKDEILNEFLSNFDGQGNGVHKAGTEEVVTWDEWYDHYCDVSMSCPTDDYYVAMMESAWQCPENEDDPEVKATVAHLYTEVKSRLMHLAQNNQVLLEKIFKDNDKLATGNLTIDEWTNLIYKLKISVDRKFVYPYFKTIDKDNSGAIEFKEFLEYCTSP